MSKAFVKDIDRGYRQFISHFGDLSGAAVFVGIRQAAGSEIDEETGMTLVGYATINEFGSSKPPGTQGYVPERSYLRSTVDEHNARYSDLIGRSVDKYLMGQGDLKAGLEGVGLIAVRDVQRKIRTLREPPNAPSTIRQKGSSNPLIADGRLVQSIDFEVAL